MRGERDQRLQKIVTKIQVENLFDLFIEVLRWHKVA